MGACSSGTTAPEMTSEELEQELFGPSADTELNLEFVELVNQCARSNGLGDYVEILESESVDFLDAAPGLTGRERTEAIGTGFIALQILQEEQFAAGPPTSEPTSDSVESEAELAILELGPVNDPETGELFESGCRAWADRSLRTSEEYLDLEQLRTEYGAWMNERYKSTPEYREIESRQFDCMAEAGYREIQSIDDLNDTVFQANDRRLSGDLSVEEALDIDRTLGLQYFDCRERFAAEFDELSDAAANDFLRNREETSEE